MSGKTELLKVNGINRIKVSFKFNTTILDAIREMDGRKWHSKEKYWSVSLTLDNLSKLQTLNFPIEDIERALNKGNDVSVSSKVFNNQLFLYQKVGVDFIEKRNGNVLIADEMGLGKSIQSLAWLEVHKEKSPVLIVCPASLKYNWLKEIRKWIGDNIDVAVLNGTKPTKINAEIYIINYDILKAWELHLKTLNFQILIMDEAHYIKNSKALRTKATMRIAKKIPHKILLTGTPIESRPSELYNIIKIIDPYLFMNKWDYLKRYCGAKHNGYGWDFNGATNIPELHKKLTSTIMIRRKKKDVLKDLPDKIFSFVPLSIENRKEYKEAERDLISYIKKDLRSKATRKQDKINEQENLFKIDEDKLKDIEYEKVTKAEEGGVLFQIEVLKQLAVKGKLKQTIKWIENFLESGEKLVVFANHKFVIEALYTTFNKISVKVDGSVSTIKRQKAVDDFQNKKGIKLFIGNIKAAGVGLTLTASSNVAILELPWTPGELSQAIDRCHRIGQKFTVNVHYLLGLGTIEEKIAKLLHSKQDVVNAILDGNVKESNNILSNLIKQI